MYLCKKCGTGVPEGFASCQVCGRAVDLPVPEVQEAPVEVPEVAEVVKPEPKKPEPKKSKKK